MEKIFRWLKSYLVCQLKGGDMERLFNLCRYQGIELWNMTYGEGICTCRMYVEDFWKIRPHLRKTRVRIKIQKRSGLAFFLAFLKKRKGLWVGMVSCITILYFLSGHIWKIEFYGNSFYTDERLTKYLSDTENIDYGVWKYKIDNPILEENLRLTFPDISWVSVRIEGTSLIISLEEMVKYGTDSSETKLPRYICAKKDGEIIKMVTRSGTPKVTIGNHVTAGELLIDGIQEVKDDSMTLTETMSVGADGDILAKVVEPYDKVYYFSGESRRYGTAACKISLSFGNHLLSFGSNPYENNDTIPYHCVTEVKYLLPGICLQTDMYRTYEIVPSLKAASQAKSQAEKELSDIFLEFDEKGVQILENNVRILMYEDRVEAKGDFILLEPIGEGTDRITAELK